MSPLSSTRSSEVLVGDSRLTVGNHVFFFSQWLFLFLVLSQQMQSGGEMDALLFTTRT